MGISSFKGALIQRGHPNREYSRGNLPAVVNAAPLVPSRTEQTKTQACLGFPS
jgi:hypothetical protein